MPPYLHPQVDLFTSLKNRERESLLSSFDGDVGCFHLLAALHYAAKNAGVQISLRSILLLDTQKWNCWIMGNAIFRFLRNGHTVLHRGYITLHSHQQYTVFQFSRLLAAICSLRLLESGCPCGCEIYLIVPLICIFLMILDVDHLFMCLLSIDPFLDLLWRNVYSNPLSVFVSGGFFSSFHLLLFSF